MNIIQPKGYGYVCWAYYGDGWGNGQAYGCNFADGGGFGYIFGKFENLAEDIGIVL